MSDGFQYSTLDNSAVKRRLEDQIAQWEGEHWGNSVNLQLAQAKMDVAAEAGDDDAYSVAEEEARTAYNNMQVNETTIAKNKEILAGLAGTKSKGDTPVTPLDVPDIPGVTTEATEPDDTVE